MEHLWSLRAALGAFVWPAEFSTFLAAPDCYFSTAWTEELHSALSRHHHSATPIAGRHAYSLGFAQLRHLAGSNAKGHIFIHCLTSISDVANQTDDSGARAVCQLVFDESSHVANYC